MPAVDAAPHTRTREWLSGAGRLGSGRAPDFRGLLLALLYLSFVTLTTIGYGDVVPASPTARMLAVATGVVGQFYLAGAAARLVSLLVAAPRNGSDAS